MMANRRMREEQLAIARAILNEVRQKVEEAASDDPKVAFQIRRYVYKNLSYDERGTPALRTKLKLQKLVEQAGKCAYPNCATPDKLMTKEDEPELYRFEAVKGFTAENTVLMHHACQRLGQKERGFS